MVLVNLLVLEDKSIILEMEATEEQKARAIKVIQEERNFK
jgi:hypothetical protein